MLTLFKHRQPAVLSLPVEPTVNETVAAENDDLFRQLGDLQARFELVRDATTEGL